MKKSPAITIVVISGFILIVLLGFNNQVFAAEKVNDENRGDIAELIIAIKKTDTEKNDKIEPQPTTLVTPAVSVSPEISPTTTVIPTISIAPTDTPTVTVQPTVTTIPSASPSPSVTAVPTISVQPAVTTQPTSIPQPTSSPEHSGIGGIVVTSTPTATPSITGTPTPTPTQTPRSIGSVLGMTVHVIPELNEPQPLEQLQELLAPVKNSALVFPTILSPDELDAELYPKQPLSDKAQMQMGLLALGEVGGGFLLTRRQFFLDLFKRIW